MATNMIPETYLVSDKITHVHDAEIDGLRKSIKALPPGYRDFLHHFGHEGEYEGSFYVRPPQLVLKDVASDRKSLLLYANLHHEGYADWPDEDVMAEGALIDRGEINQAFVLGRNDNGDQIVFTPSRPDSVFLFHRHSEAVVEVEGGFLDPLLIAFHGEKTECFRFFKPIHPDIEHHNIFLAQVHPNKAISQWMQDYWGVEARFRVQMPEFWDSRDPYLVFVKAIGGMCTVLNDTHNHKQYVQIMYDSKRWWAAVAAFERARPL